MRYVTVLAVLFALFSSSGCSGWLQRRQQPILSRIASLKKCVHDMHEIMLSRIVSLENRAWNLQKTTTQVQDVISEKEVPTMSGKRTSEIHAGKNNIQVTATKLLTEYNANAVAADVRYNSKVLVVDGLVESIKPAILDNSLIVALRSFSHLHTVNCAFSKTKAHALAKLNKNDRIFIQGTCEGKTFFSVNLRDCDIVTK